MERLPNLDYLRGVRLADKLLNRVAEVLKGAEHFRDADVENAYRSFGTRQRREKKDPHGAKNSVLRARCHIAIAGPKKSRSFQVLQRAQPMAKNVESGGFF